jgi:transposase
MAKPIPLRNDYDADRLRVAAKQSRSPRQVRRLLSLAAVYDGKSRTEAARIGGMDRQTLRDWVIRFNEEGPDGLTDRPRPGGPCKLNDSQLEEVASLVEAGPDHHVHGVQRWRAQDLARVIEDRFGVVYAERSVLDLLKRLSFSHISGRPQHPGQDPQVIEDFKTTFPALSKLT